VSLSRTVFGSEFQMAGAVQRNARFAIVTVTAVDSRITPALTKIFVGDDVRRTNGRYRRRGAVL